MKSVRKLREIILIKIIKISTLIICEKELKDGFLFQQKQVK
ncbi:hypothetical protein CDIMF43_180107 [Carnobacterium divergens]|nr:hypothetical protein CDIMF43_180107 [Carnobacterium divergens]